jgi:hypothetical protein
MSIIIHQNTNLSRYGVDDSTRIVRYPGSSLHFEIPFINGKLHTNLTQEEQEKVELMLDVKMNSEQGAKFYSELKFTLPADITSLDIENNAMDLLTYKLGLKQGFIAPDKETTLSAMCNALFYVYDSKHDNEEKVNMFRIKAKASGKVNNSFEDDPDYLILITKHMFNQYSGLDVNKSYNKLLEYIEATKKGNSNANDVIKAFEIERDELELRVDVLEAMSNQRGIIKKNTKGMYYNPMTNTEFGRTVDAVIAYLKNDPAELEEQSYSIRVQLNK